MVLLSGVGTVFDDVAGQSYLPHVVGRDRLMAANTGISSLNAGSEVAGRSVGGYLVAAATAAGAVMVDVAGFLLSALMLMRIRRPEAKAERGPTAICDARCGRGCGSSSAIRSCGRSPSPAR
ncbi:hypothetical protein ACFQHO_19205 [Actinomadura yumaensis]|uniref:hypothetical protein n=1 Tax=Actinomadura yumaensis TaxID=111807 RepID=UPI00361879BD